MNTIASEVMRPIHRVEGEACARFYDHVGLGVAYRSAPRGADIKRIIALFTKRGYEIDRHTISEDGTEYQLSLMYEGVEIASQTVQITIEIKELIIYDK